jgi:hypothetical protein
LSDGWWRQYRNRQRRDKFLRRGRRCSGWPLLAVAPNLDPDIVAAARGNDREPVALRRERRRQLVFDRTELGQRALQFLGQQLRDHAAHRLEIEALGRQLDRPRRRHHVRFLTHMHDEGVAIGADNRG